MHIFGLWLQTPFRFFFPFFDKQGTQSFRIFFPALRGPHTKKGKKHLCIWIPFFWFCKGAGRLTFGTTLVTYSASSLGCPDIRTLTNGSMMSPLILCSDLGKCCPLMILIRNFLAATTEDAVGLEGRRDLGGSSKGKRKGSENEWWWQMNYRAFRYSNTNLKLIFGPPYF